MENTFNSIILCGELMGIPTFSHENHSKNFYRFSLEVQRLSGTTDLLEILAPENLIQNLDVFGGGLLLVTGQIRSFNSNQEHGRKLIITVFADSVITCDHDPKNEAVLTGCLCKQPVYRKTPLGREICDIMLAVNRPYRRTDYIPCILWGRTAQIVADKPVGTKIQLWGRLQSRQYIKVVGDGSEQRTTYEVSVVKANIEEDSPLDYMES